MKLEDRLVLLAQRIRSEFNKWHDSIGAINGIAPLNSAKIVPDLNLPRYVKRTVQTVTQTALPINWANGLVVYFTMPAATVTTVIANYQNPVVGDFHTIIITNTTGASRNYVLPATLHKAASLTVAVGNNQRRKMVAIYDGTNYDWTIDAAKTL